MTQTDLEILQAAYRDALARLKEVEAKLAAEVKATCQAPEQHFLVQHRDRMPKWCNTCRRFADGSKVDDPSTGW